MSNARFYVEHKFVWVEINDDYMIYKYKICDAWNKHDFNFELVDEIPSYYIWELIKDINAISVDVNNCYIELTGDVCVKLTIKKHKTVFVIEDIYNEKLAGV